MKIVRMFLGLSPFTEIGRVIGVSGASVRNRLNRLRRYNRVWNGRRELPVELGDLVELTKRRRVERAAFLRHGQRARLSWTDSELALLALYVLDAHRLPRGEVYAICRKFEGRHSAVSVRTKMCLMRSRPRREIEALADIGTEAAASFCAPAAAPLGEVPPGVHL